MVKLKIQSRASARALIALALALLLRVGAADAADVKIDNFAFAPQSLTIKAGATVTWANEDDIPHTVVASGKQFRSKALDTGDKFTFAFTTPGVYTYFCSLHPHMTGTIIVQAADAARATQ
jgi:plastocyanin